MDHRIFGEDELWVAKEPDFNSIGDASFARMKSTETNTQTYNAYVGKALVNFIIKYVLLFCSVPAGGRLSFLQMGGYFRKFV